MITEKALDEKYPVDTPHWRKDGVERYLCEKHDLPTIFIRDLDMVVHTLTETECN